MAGGMGGVYPPSFMHNAGGNAYAIPPSYGQAVVPNQRLKIDMGAGMY